MKYLTFLLVVFVAGAVQAQTVDVSRFGRADVIILGEVHDNPRHHAAQAAVVATVQPAAIVFEMLTAGQADLITDQNRNDQAVLQDAIGWDATGWPNFSQYFPIITAGGTARILGAGLTRSAAHRAFKIGVSVAFGPGAGIYGLNQPLGAQEQAERVAFQLSAHCDALPESMLAGMVDLQRLRDAMLARTVVRALEMVGRPVVVITGNGHARKDRGLAVYLGNARSDLEIYAVGLAEDGKIDGVFDQVVSFAPVVRPDPCLAFDQNE